MGRSRRDGAMTGRHPSVTRTRLLRRTMPDVERTQRARLSQLLDLLAEDDRLNVYAGELEVRPPGAPTIEAV